MLKISTVHNCLITLTDLTWHSKFDLRRKITGTTAGLIIYNCLGKIQIDLAVLPLFPADYCHEIDFDCPILKITEIKLGKGMLRINWEMFSLREIGTDAWIPLPTSIGLTLMQTRKLKTIMSQRPVTNLYLKRDNIMVILKRSAPQRWRPLPIRDSENDLPSLSQPPFGFPIIDWMITNFTSLHNTCVMPIWVFIYYLLSSVRRVQFWVFVPFSSFVGLIVCLFVCLCLCLLLSSNE